MEDNFYWINGDGEADHCNASYMLKSDLRQHDERIRKAIAEKVRNYLYDKWFTLNGVKIMLPLGELEIITKLITDEDNNVSHRSRSNRLPCKQGMDTQSPV